MMTIGPLRYLTRPDSGFLVVQYQGCVETTKIAQEWFDALETELRQYNLQQILWDSRGADPNPPEVRAYIWQWLERAEVLKRSAILVESEMLRISANLSAVGGRIRLRSFHDQSEAADWLRQGAPPQ